MTQQPSSTRVGQSAWLRCRATVFMAVLCVLALPPAGALAQSSQTLPTEPLTIIGDGARHAFRVEMAITDRDRERGLMYRREVAPDAGMLFIWNRPQHISMWMKNTLIPLDMLFIDAAGVIVRIEQNTTPLSLTSIPSGEPVVAVLELAGGRTQALGVRAGHRVEHPAFE